MRDIDKDSAGTGPPNPPTQSALDAAINAPPAPGGPGLFMGPVDKTGVTASLGMKGKQRFDWVMSSQAMLQGGHDFDTWIQNLPEDPNDLEYTRLLRTEKTNATARVRVRSETGDKGYPNAGPKANTQPNIGPPSTNFKTNGEVVKFKDPASPNVVVDSPNGVLMDSSKQAKRVQKELDARDEGEQQRLYREKVGTKPIIMGLKVSDTDALAGSPDNPGGAPDGMVSEWAAGRGLTLDNEHAARAARSGNWVYQGEQRDPAGGPGYTRSVYVYVDDAKAQIASYSPDDIKKFQKQLGSPETGIPTGDIKTVWDEAVKGAGDLAMMGKKVELKFIFEQLLRTYAAAKKSGGGGGGGGGGAFSGQLSGADMVGADYYQAMMQVLGDVSGVKP